MSKKGPLIMGKIKQKGGKGGRRGGTYYIPRKS
jgi:hypothetical protein